MKLTRDALLHFDILIFPKWFWYQIKLWQKYFLFQFLKLQKPVHKIKFNFRKLNKNRPRQKQLWRLHPQTFPRQQRHQSRKRNSQNLLRQLSQQLNKLLLLVRNTQHTPVWYVFLSTAFLKKLWGFRITGNGALYTRDYSTPNVRTLFSIL